MDKVIIYTSNSCTNCNIVKHYMSINNIPYEEKNIQEDDKYRKELEYWGFKSIPVLVVNGEYHAVTSTNFKEYLKDVKR